MAHIGDTQLVALDPGRRRVGALQRPFVPPARPLVPPELPAQQLEEGLRRRSVGIEEARAVEMIADRPE